MNTKLKKAILAFAVLCLLGATSAVVADTAIGTVNVVPEVPKIKDFSFPSDVDPESVTPLLFTLEYLEGLESGDSVWVHLWRDGFAADLDYVDAPSTGDLNSHYWARWMNIIGGGWWDYSTSSRINNVVGPDGIDMPVIDGSDIPLGFDIKFYGLAEYGLWHLRVGLLYASETLVAEHSMDFDMNARLAVDILESTFDFGEVQKNNLVQIPIVNPTEGYLTIVVLSNVGYLLQLSGTDPDNGLGDSFLVGNIVQNSVDDDVGAVPLTGILAGLNGMEAQPSGEGTFYCYLWISVPLVPVGTYTFTLTFLVVAI